MKGLFWSKLGIRESVRLGASASLAAILVAGALCACDKQAPPPPPQQAKAPEKPLALPDVAVIEGKSLKVGISPSAGRIVSFSVDGGPNLLWLNSADAVEKLKSGRPGVWINYGGDKVWPAQQAIWPKIHGGSWPPDPAIDGSPWTIAEKSERRVVFKSPDVPKLSIRVVRTIEIPDDSPTLVIKNRLERYADNEFPVEIWSITQVPLPSYSLMDIWKEQPDPSKTFQEMYSKGAAELVLDGKALRHTPTAADAKSGTLGSWLAAVYPGYAFLQSFDALPGASYPDSASLETYTNKSYMELETLAEAKELKPGEALECKVVWSFLRLPDGNEPDDVRKAVLKALEGKP